MYTVGQDAPLYAFFRSGGVAKTGLSPTIRVRKPDGSLAATDASMSPVANMPGHYQYIVSGANVNQRGGWTYTAHTNDTSVEAQDQAAGVFVDGYARTSGYLSGQSPADLVGRILLDGAPAYLAVTDDGSLNGIGPEGINADSIAVTAAQKIAASVVAQTTSGAATGSLGGQVNATATAVTIANTQATAAKTNTDTLLTRVGPFTGTGTSTVYGFLNLIKPVTDLLNAMIETVSGVTRYKADSLSQAPTGSGGGGGTTIKLVALPTRTNANGRAVHLVSNDASPARSAILFDDHEVFGIPSGWTVRYRMRINGGATVIDAAAVVHDAEFGIVKYEFTAPLPAPGRYFEAWILFNASGVQQQTFPSDGLQAVVIESGIPAL